MVQGMKTQAQSRETRWECCRRFGRTHSGLRTYTLIISRAERVSLLMQSQTPCWHGQWQPQHTQTNNWESRHCDHGVGNRWLCPIALATQRITMVDTNNNRGCFYSQQWMRIVDNTKQIYLSRSREEAKQARTVKALILSSYHIHLEQNIGIRSYHPESVSFPNTLSPVMYLKRLYTSFTSLMMGVPVSMRRDERLLIFPKCKRLLVLGFLTRWASSSTIWSKLLLANQ